MSNCLAIYVHEFQKEVGHSRALIEILKNAKKLQSYDEIHVIAYDVGEIKDLLEKYQGVFRIFRVPKFFSGIFMTKAIFFQIYAYFLSLFLGHDRFLKISMGTAVLHADVSYVQFIQEQAAYFYFENYQWNLHPMCLIRYCYKKILFLYFIFCERVLFFKENIKIICCGKFMEDFLLKKYLLSAKQLTTVYSSVDFKEFSGDNFSDKNILAEMLDKYPVLKELNLSAQVYLFVGAFERKGLGFAIDALRRSSDKEKQLIVVGMPEAGRELPEHSEVKIFWIPYTKEISKFYQIAGVFIFPTIYEPFGLVIIEAYRMGLQLYVTKSHVGACELIPWDDHIVFIDEVKDFSIKAMPKITLETKAKLMKNRSKLLTLISWEKSSQEFFEFIN